MNTDRRLAHIPGSSTPICVNRFLTAIQIRKDLVFCQDSVTTKITKITKLRVLRGYHIPCSAIRSTLWFRSSGGTKFISVPFCVAVLVALFVTGCGGLSTLEPPDVNADEAAAAAIESYDKDSDGTLSDTELEALPAVTMGTADKDNDGKVSAAEIAERIRLWSEGETGLMTFYCNVTMDGRPLEGATVTLDPEPFLGDAVKPASGVTRSDGAILKVDPELLPADQRTMRGVQPGLYKVRITHPSAKIPAQFNTETTLGQEVIPGTTGGNYKVTSR
jgi:hypothetical protein